jgi:hypothetical protein
MQHTRAGVLTISASSGCAFGHALCCRHPVCTGPHIQYVSKVVSRFLWRVPEERGFGLMTEFTGHLDTAPDYTLQFTVTYTNTHTHTHTIVNRHVFIVVAW